MRVRACMCSWGLGVRSSGLNLLESEAHRSELERLSCYHPALHWMGHGAEAQNEKARVRLSVALGSWQAVLAHEHQRLLGPAGWCPWMADLLSPGSRAAGGWKESGRGQVRPGLESRPALSEPHWPAGVKVLFRVGLTLVRLALGTTEQRLACPGLLETPAPFDPSPLPSCKKRSSCPRWVPLARPAVAQQPPAQLGKQAWRSSHRGTGLHSCPLSSREGGNPRPQVPFSLPLLSVRPSASATSWGCVLPALRGSHHFLPSP